MTFSAATLREATLHWMQDLTATLVAPEACPPQERTIDRRPPPRQRPRPRDDVHHQLEQPQHPEVRARSDARATGRVLGLVVRRACVLARAIEAALGQRPIERLVEAMTRASIRATTAIHKPCCRCFARGRNATLTPPPETRTHATTACSTRESPPSRHLTTALEHPPGKPPPARPPQHETATRSRVHQHPKRARPTRGRSPGPRRRRSKPIGRRRSKPS